jgi:hypothetical protein
VDSEQVTQVDIEIRAADRAGNEAVARQTITINRPAS